MAIERKAIVFGFVFLIAALVLLLTLGGVYLYLPLYVESKILPEIVRKAGFSEYACDVRRIGFSGVDLGPLRIGDVEKPAISIDSVQIDYTFSGLYRKEIERVSVNGIELSCGYENGKFSIRGIDLSAVLARFQLSNKTGAGSRKASPPVGIRRLEIHGAVVALNWREKRLRFPMEIEVVPEAQGRDTPVWNELNGAVRLYARGQEIVFTSKLHLSEKKLILGFEANSICLERFSDITALIPGLTLSGEADIKGAAVFRYAPFFVHSASATCRIRNAETMYNDFKLKYSQGHAKEPQPIIVEMSGREGGERMILAEYNVFAPFVRVSSDSADIQLPAVSLNGEARLSRLENRFGISTSFSGFASEIKGSARSTAIQISSVTLTGESEFGYSEKHADVSGTCNVAADDIKVRSDFTTLHIPSVSLCAKGGIDASTNKGAKVASYEINLSDTYLTTASASMKIPGASFSGMASGEKDRPLQLGGLLEIKGASVTALDPKTKIAGIRGVVPLKWPVEGPGKTGEYSITDIEWEGLRLGSVRGPVQQKGSGAAFKGVFTSNLFPELSLNFTGNAGFESSRGFRAGVHFESDPYRTNGDIDLGRFHPPAGGVIVNGDFGMKGDLSYDSVGPKGSLILNVQNANVMISKKGAAINGIRTELVLNELPRIRSEPGQRLYFQKASLGALNIDTGSIDFQIESPTSLFIEKSRFRWCNGNVYTQAMRFSPGIDDYEVILYCDRLDLAKILKQFGTVNADGTGSVNGRLPLRINKGKIRIDDGFLFSTPGEKGTIHITGTEILTRGVPPDSVQYAQIELAREALKDYAYDWVKLNLMSEGENLVLRLQFDGKPARALPFAYRKEMGGFARVDAIGEGSVFQGISLDVNFTVPLDKILQYKGLLEMMHNVPK